MQATRHTTLFTHPQITDHSLPPTDYTDYTDKLCGSARETLTADYTDYTDKTLRLCAGILPTDYTDYTDKLCDSFPLQDSYLCGSARGYCPQGFKP